MSVEGGVRPRSAFCIVLGNEKGGSGKSTVAMHVAVALLKAGQRVATIDLDSRQQSFTHYVANRRAWSKHAGLDLEMPSHYCIGRKDGALVSDNEAGEFSEFAAAIDSIEHDHDFIVIDTPGHDSYLMRLAHAMRNRVSMLGSRNKRLVGEGLQELSLRLGFRAIDGFAERVIFREFYSRGLTALDDLHEDTLGTRPNLSHITARQEVETLLKSLRLPINERGIRRAAARQEWFAAQARPLELPDIIAP